MEQANEMVKKKDEVPNEGEVKEVLLGSAAEENAKTTPAKKPAEVKSEGGENKEVMIGEQMPEKKGSKAKWVLIVILILAVLGALGYFMFF